MIADALETIHRLAIKHGITIATAESLTAGMVASNLATLSGSSAYFRGGVAAYTIDAKVEILGVDRKAAENCNCVSGEVAEQMALGACKLFHADCVIATTGYAEPWPESGIDKAFAFTTILLGSTIKTTQHDLSYLNREDARKAVTQSALTDLAAMLEG